MFDLADYVQVFSYNGIVRKLEVFRPTPGSGEEGRDFVLLEDLGDHFDVSNVHFVRENGVSLAFTRDRNLKRHVPERIPACNGSTIYIVPKNGELPLTAVPSSPSSSPSSSSSLSLSSPLSPLPSPPSLSSSKTTATTTTVQHNAPAEIPNTNDIVTEQQAAELNSIVDNLPKKRNPHGSMSLNHAHLDKNISNNDTNIDNGNGNETEMESKEELEADPLGSYSEHSSTCSHSSCSDSMSSSQPSPVPVDAKLPDWVYTFHSQQSTQQYDDGRTRHNVESAPYMLPNDTAETYRLYAQHYIVRYCFQGNYNVKLDHGAELKILDVATGTGVWAMEMAQEFPMAEIHGVDISPIFPTPETSIEVVPPNCHFQLCNVLDGLPFPDNHFDFVYQRLLVYALTPAQRNQVNTEVLRVLKPSGYTQLIESDGLIYNAGPTTEMTNTLSLMTPKKNSVDPTDVRHLKPGLVRAGFSHVRSFCIALPVGDWGGKLGQLSRQNMHGLAGIWLRGEFGKQTLEECEETLAEMDKECEQRQSFYKVWLVVGQKPSVKILLPPPLKTTLSAFQPCR